MPDTIFKECADERISEAVVGQLAVHPEANQTHGAQRSKLV